jgi:hypothetical protein
MEKYPDHAAIIKPGLEKLESYRAHASNVPAYILAMGEHMILFRCKLSSMVVAVINPMMKLNWFLTHAPHQMQWAKNFLLSEVCIHLV